MSKIVIYSTDRCPYCERAKQLLRNKNVNYQEIRVDKEAGKLDEMIARTQLRTVPQIFIGEHHVGGFDKLYLMEQEGKLDPLLQSITED